MQTVLSEFLIKQDTSSIQTLAFDIVSKYTESTFMDRTKSSKKLYNIYLKYHILWKKHYFLMWKANLKKRWRTNKNSSNFLSTVAKKEQDSLMSCTFQPKINRSSRSMNKLRNVPGLMKSDPFSRLYKDHEKYRNKKDLRKEEMLRKENNLLRSTPELINSYTNISLNQNNVLFSKSFIERQEDYLYKKSKNKDKLLRENEEIESMIFTFTPSINQSNTTIKVPAHHRLYK